MSQHRDELFSATALGGGDPCPPTAAQGERGEGPPGPQMEARGPGPVGGWRRPEDGPQSPPARRGSPGSQTRLYIVYAVAPEAPRHLPRDS